MRKALLFSALLFSLTTLASTTLELVSGDYKITAKLTGAADIYAGSVEATTQTNGTCMGTYVLDFANNKLEIKFTSGPSDMCANESAVVTVSPMQFGSLMRGNTMELMFTSNMFNTCLPAQVRVTETDIQ